MSKKATCPAPLHDVVMRLRGPHKTVKYQPANPLDVDEMYRLTSEAADEIEKLRNAIDWIVDEIHQGVMHANGLRDVSLSHESQIQSDGMLKAWSQAASIANRGKERANKSA